MAEQIWVVTGSAGSYDNRVEWLVDSWRSESGAQARVLFLTEQLQSLGPVTYHNRDAVEEHMHQFDPACQVEVSNTSYSYEVLELKQ